MQNQIPEPTPRLDQNISRDELIEALLDLKELDTISGGRGVHYPCWYDSGLDSSSTL